MLSNAALINAERVFSTTRDADGAVRFGEAVLDVFEAHLDPALPGTGHVALLEDGEAEWHIDGDAGGVIARLRELVREAEALSTVLALLSNLRLFVDLPRFLGAANALYAGLREEGVQQVGGIGLAPLDPDEIDAALREAGSEHSVYVSMAPMFLASGQAGAYWHTLTGFWLSWPDSHTIAPASGVALGRVGADVAGVADVLEHLCLGVLVPPTALHAVVALRRRQLPADTDRPIFGRRAVPPVVYFYGFEDIAGPIEAIADAPGVDAITQMHLRRAGHRAKDVAASVITERLVVLHREILQEESFFPNYVVLAGGGGDGGAVEDEVLSRAVEFVQLETALTDPLWDLSTDIEMHDTHLDTHRLIVSDGRRAANGLTQASSPEALRTMQIALTVIDNAAVGLADDARRIERRFDDLHDSSEMLAGNFDERPLRPAIPVSDAVIQSGWLDRVRPRLDRVRGRWDRLEVEYVGLQGSVRGLFEEQRSSELAELDRNSAGLGIVLALLAAVLAFQAIVDFQVTASEELKWALRVVTALVVVVLVLTVGWTRVRRWLPGVSGEQQRMTEFVATALDFADRARVLAEAGADDPRQIREADRELAVGFAGLWDRAREQAATTDASSLRQTELWAVTALLLGARPERLYGTPLPLAAAAYAAAGAVSDFEFAHAFDRSPLVALTGTDARQWLATAGRQAAAEDLEAAITELDAALYGQLDALIRAGESEPSED